MSDPSQEISGKIKTFIIEQYLKGSAEDLTNELPLISSGLIDSISILQVVEFLETTFEFEFQPHEVDHSNLDTISNMVLFVQGKLTK